MITMKKLILLVRDVFSIIYYQATLYLMARIKNKFKQKINFVNCLNNFHHRMKVIKQNKYFYLLNEFIHFKA